MADNAFSNNVQSLKELKAAYKQAMNEMAAGSAGASQRVEALRSQLDDLQDQTQTLRGSGVEKLSTSMGLMREAFVNADPGKLGIALKGLGAAMKAIPIFLIIEGIRYLVENFEKLKNSSGLLGQVFKAIGVVVDALVQGFKDLTDWLGITNNAIEDNAELTIEKAKQTQDVVTARYDAEIKLAKAAGKETLDLEIKKQQAIIDSAKVQFEAIKAVAAANGVVTQEQTEKVIELGKMVAAAQLEIDTKRIEHDTKVTEDLKKVQEKRKSDLAASLKEQQKIAEDAMKERDANDAKELEATKSLLDKKETLVAASEGTTMELQKQRAIEEIDALFEQSDRSQAALEAANTAKLAIEQKYQSDKAALEKKGADDAAKAQNDAIQKQGAEIIKMADEQLAALEKRNKAIVAGFNSVASSASTILSAISDFNAAKLDEELKAREEGLNAQLSALDSAREAELSKEGLTADQKVAIENKYKMQKYQLELADYNATTKIKKQAFEQDKKMKIAQTIISTITGTIAAVTGMISAIPGPVGIVLGAIAGAAVAAAGILQVAKIRKTTFDAGTPPSPPTLSAPSAPSDLGGENASPQSAPDFSIFDKDSTGQGTANSQSSKGSSITVKAVVVAQEITDTQTQTTYSNTMGTL